MPSGRVTWAPTDHPSLQTPFMDLILQLGELVSEMVSRGSRWLLDAVRENYRIGSRNALGET